LSELFLIGILINKWGLGIGDWGLGIGDWGLGPIPNPQYLNIFELTFNLFKLNFF
jgi:hypothetical protein